MDPDAWLQEVRSLLRQRGDDATQALRWRMDDMAGWLAKGGFAPSERAWSAC